MINNRDLAASVAAACAPLGVALETHVRKHETLIPHIFMDEVLAHLRSLGRDAGRVADTRGIVDALERGLEAGDRETRNVISLFLSEAGREPFFPAISPLLGPRARAHLAAT